MKLYLKIILGIVLLISLYFLSDILSIKLNNKPLIYISKETNLKDIKYKGLIYDTYYCESLNSSKIISKTSNYSCSIDKVSENFIYAVVMEVSDDGAYIKGIKDNNNLQIDEVGYLIINEDTIIDKNLELKTGQRIKVEADLIQETYPIRILTKKITFLPSLNFSIENTTEVCADALELIWSDYLYDYSLPCISSANIKITIDQKEYLLKDALEKHKITIEELIKSELLLYKEAK